MIQGLLSDSGHSSENLLASTPSIGLLKDHGDILHLSLKKQGANKLSAAYVPPSCYYLNTPELNVLLH